MSFNYKQNVRFQWRRMSMVSVGHTSPGTHAAIKYQLRTSLFCPGAVIPHITALLRQGPPCLDYRAETNGPSHLLSCFWALSLRECVHTSHLGLPARQQHFLLERRADAQRQLVRGKGSHFGLLELRWRNPQWSVIDVHYFPFCLGEIQRHIVFYPVLEELILYSTWMDMETRAILKLVSFFLLALLQSFWRAFFPSVVQKDHRVKMRHSSVGQMMVTSLSSPSPVPLWRLFGCFPALNIEFVPFTLKMLTG